MDVTFRFYGLFAVHDALRPGDKNGPDPRSSADICFPDAARYSGSIHAAHPTTLKGHRPVLCVPDDAIDMESPFAEEAFGRAIRRAGTTTAFELEDCEVHLLLNGKEAEGGVAFDEKDENGDKHNLHWLLSMSELMGRRVTINPKYLNGTAAQPLFCRFALRTGKLSVYSLLGEGEYLFCDVDGTRGGPKRGRSITDRKVAEKLDWVVSLEEGDGAPTIVLKGAKTTIVPLRTDIPIVIHVQNKCVEEVIEVEVAGVLGAEKRANDLLALYMLLNESIPDADRRVLFRYEIPMTDLNSYCPPGGIP